MTENYLPAWTPPQRGEPLPPASAEEQGTADVVKDQATDLSHSSIQTGKHVAGVAREQASGVAVEAGRQGRDLLHQAQGQLEEQAAQGQQRLANQLLSLSDELRSMAGASGQGGMAAGLASQAASRVRMRGSGWRTASPARWRRRCSPSRAAGRRYSWPWRWERAWWPALTRGLKDADSDDSAAAAAAAATQGLSGQRAQPSGMASYPPATAAGVSDQAPGLSVPASGLPPAGGDPAWEAGPAYGERSPLVTDDQAGRQGTL